jgi:hypothetical protein
MIAAIGRLLCDPIAEVRASDLEWPLRADGRSESSRWANMRHNSAGDLFSDMRASVPDLAMRP